MAGRPKKQAAKRTRRKGERIPWQEIEDRWVQGGDDVTHRSVAKEFDVPAQKIGHYASENHWSVKRVAYRSRLRKEVSERVFEESASLATEVKMRGLRDRLHQLVQLEEAREAAQAIKVLKVRSTEYDDRGKPTRSTEEIVDHIVPWSSQDHVNHRRAFDEAYAGLLRDLGAEEGEETDISIRVKYLPDWLKGGEPGEGP